MSIGERHCRSIVVKIASRCNLNCSYCYVYNMGDLSYLQQPALMSRRTIDSLMVEAGRHARINDIETFTFVLHGGEPLLAPDHLLDYFVRRARDTFGSALAVDILMQTNGTLLTRAKCRLLKDLGIRIGISLDGLPEQHDAARVYHTGRGSYDDVVEGWRNAQAAGLDPGLLCVIDLDADPKAVLENISALRPRVVDFLLPDANHRLPPRRVEGDSTPYATWLLRLFDVWSGRPQPTFRIKILDSIFAPLSGRASMSDSLGKGLNEVLCVETDGSITPTDVLKICGPEWTDTGCNINTHSLADALHQPQVERYSASHLALCDTCERCGLSPVCGGGHIAHRYSNPGTFDNPSVYCGDLAALIEGIVSRVLQNGVACA